jgi:non-homologous end joining protein Ku
MSADVIGYIIGGVVLLLSGVYVQRSTVKANAQTAQAKQVVEAAAQKTESRRVDGEAYDRAMQLNHEMTDALQKPALMTFLPRLQATVTDLSAALDAALERARKAEAERDVANAQLNDPRLRNPIGGV